MKPQFDPRKAHEKGDTLPEQANVYVPPRPLAQISEHRTMDIKAIRIAAEIDPRQAKTIVRMQAPPARRQRGLVLFTIGSLLVIALLGAAAYVTLVGPQPTPLVTDSEPPQHPAAPGEAHPPSAPPTASPEALTAPTQPATAMAPPVSAPEATAAQRPGTRAAQHAAPRKPKVSKDPWLE